MTGVCGGVGAVEVIDRQHANLEYIPDQVYRYSKTLEALHLDANQIQVLPKDLFKLTKLRQLTLSDNEISKLPGNIGALLALLQLDVSRNDISEIPEAIKFCKCLQTADFSSNPISRLPEGFMQLSSLTNLSINDISLCELPYEVKNLVNLKRLEMRDNFLRLLPDSIGDLRSLESLDLGGNELEYLPLEIGSLRCLRELYLDSNDIQMLPSSLGRLQSLESLDLSVNRLKEIPLETCQLSNLEDLSLTDNKLRCLPPKIGNLKKLSSLKIDINFLEEVPESIGMCEKLEQLFLAVNVLAALPESFGNLKCITSLHVDKNRLFDLPDSICECTNLSILSARRNLLRAIPEDIGNLHNLRVLDLTGNQLFYLPKSLLSIKHLRAVWLSTNQGSQCFPKMHLESMRLDAGTGAVIGMGVASDASVSSSFDVTVAGGACSDPSLEEHPNSAEDSNSGSTLLKQVLTTYLLPQKPGEADTPPELASICDTARLLRLEEEKDVDEERARARVMFSDHVKVAFGDVTDHPHNTHNASSANDSSNGLKRHGTPHPRDLKQRNQEFLNRHSKTEEEMPDFYQSNVIQKKPLSAQSSADSSDNAGNEGVLFSAQSQPSKPISPPSFKPSKTVPNNNNNVSSSNATTHAEQQRKILSSVASISVTSSSPTRNVSWKLTTSVVHNSKKDPSHQPAQITPSTRCDPVPSSPTVAAAFNNLQNWTKPSAGAVPSSQMQVQPMWGVPLARDEEELTTEQDVTDDESEVGGNGMFTDLPGGKEGMRMFTRQLGSEANTRAFGPDKEDNLEEAVYEAIPETDVSEAESDLMTSTSAAANRAVHFVPATHPMNKFVGNADSSTCGHQSVKDSPSNYSLTPQQPQPNPQPKVPKMGVKFVDDLPEIEVSVETLEVSLHRLHPAESFGFSLAPVDPPGGIFVTKVATDLLDSPAQHLLNKNDQILKVNNLKIVDGVTQHQQVVDILKASMDVTLTLERHVKRVTNQPDSPPPAMSNSSSLTNSSILRTSNGALNSQIKPTPVLKKTSTTSASNTPLPAPPHPPSSGTHQHPKTTYPVNIPMTGAGDVPIPSDSSSLSCTYDDKAMTSSSANSPGMIQEIVVHRNMVGGNWPFTLAAGIPFWAAWNLNTRADEFPVIYISSVPRNSSHNTALTVGDRVLAIEGRDLTTSGEVTLQLALDILVAHTAANTIKLLIQHPPPEPPGLMEVVLVPGNDKIGINIRGGLESRSSALDLSSNISCNAIYISSVQPMETAANDGRLKPGHRILSVNGVTMIKVTHEDAVQALRSRDSYGRLKITVCDDGYNLRGGGGGGASGDLGGLPPPCYQSAVGGDDNGVGTTLSSSNLSSSSDEDNLDTESIGTDSNCEGAGGSTAGAGGAGGRVAMGGAHKTTSPSTAATNAAAHQKMYIRNISANQKMSLTNSRYAPSSNSSSMGSGLGGSSGAIRSDSAMALVGTTSTAGPPPHFQYQPQQRYSDFAIDS